MLISNHRLLIKDPQASLDFYQNVLGMTLVHQTETEQSQHYFLSFAEPQQASLELVNMPDADFSVAAQPNAEEGYWKFSIAVPSLEATHAGLVKRGVAAGDCFNIAGLAYLCHFNDPNGYSIELVQQRLFEHSPPLSEELLAATTIQPVAKGATFNLSTLRVKDANHSLAFYQSLGMELVYRYRSDARAMTLYFLVFKDDEAYQQLKQSPNIAEALWQYPATVLELQQFDGTELNSNFAYQVGPQTGFLGLDIYRGLSHSSIGQQRFQLDAKQVPVETLIDPDGYVIRCFD
ncbi:MULTISPECIES: VOC family protein [unclassified Agarivorans]|uniref:VOC family protein n=1 Tax=unclassified Agarivorans TaxID=2636026 RepID=UPI0026E412B7|nr:MULTISPECIES: VOC family protein [unclassified Agarivorans]MDO6684363.1 VOC family protein [Agarivorans sp. 3_MG-2023]MDO6714528.1 VOC family protein [Agarivorans sp. 2_MG-2023]